MRIKIYLSTLIIVFSLFGCTYFDLIQKSAMIQKDQTMQEVFAVYGQPDNRQFMGEYEVWQYCQSRQMTNFGEYVLVWFGKGIVIGVTNYHQSSGSDCTDSFQKIDWYDIPGRPYDYKEFKDFNEHREQKNKGL